MELLLSSAVLLTALGFGFYRLRLWLGRFREETLRLHAEREQALAALAALPPLVQEVRANIEAISGRMATLEQRVMGWERHLPQPDPRHAVWADPPELDRRLETLAPIAAAPGTPPEALVRFLDALEHRSPEAAAYFEGHRKRTLTTLSHVPPGPGRALELGSYGVMAAALERVLGYTVVETANFGHAGQEKTEQVKFTGQPPFAFTARLFNAERDPFPYPDDTFDLVLFCEILEHFSADPLHCLRECRRILKPGGHLMLTTPNISSYLAVARTLEGAANPQLYSTYARNGEDPPHVREYTPFEVVEALRCAGLTATRILTEQVAWETGGVWVRPLLERLAFPPLLRGEMLYCLAQKGEETPGERYPAFLYDL